MNNLESQLIDKAFEEAKKKQAIAFAEWTAQGLWSTYRGQWYQYRNEDNPISGDQLYDIFLKQQS